MARFTGSVFGRLWEGAGVWGALRSSDLCCFALLGVIERAKKVAEGAVRELLCIEE